MSQMKRSITMIVAVMVCFAIGFNLAVAVSTRQAREAESTTGGVVNITSGIPVLIYRQSSNGKVNVFTTWMKWPAARPVADLYGQFIQPFEEVTGPVSDALLQLPMAQDYFNQINTIASSELPIGTDPSSIFQFIFGSS